MIWKKEQYTIPQCIYICTLNMSIYICVCVHYTYTYIYIYIYTYIYIYIHIYIYIFENQGEEYTQIVNFNKKTLQKAMSGSSSGTARGWASQGVSSHQEWSARWSHRIQGFGKSFIEGIGIPPTRYTFSGKRTISMAIFKSKVLNHHIWLLVWNMNFMFPETVGNI